MWNVDDADDNDCRVLHHTDKTALNLLPDDQTAAREAPTRADMLRVLQAIGGPGAPKTPKFTNDDLDRIREKVGGVAFQAAPSLKRVT